MFKSRSKYSNTHHKNAEDNISLDSGYCSIYTTSGLDTSCEVNEDEEAPSLEEQEPAITKPCSSSEAGRMLIGRRSIFVMCITVFTSAFKHSTCTVFDCSLRTQ